MKKIFPILFLFLFENILLAQKIDSIKSVNNNFKKNAVFIELGGSSFFGFSFNYKRIFYQNEIISLSGSIGAGVRLFGWSTKPLLLPFKMTIKLKHFEFGIGASNCINFGQVNDNTYIPKIIGIKYQPNEYLYHKVFYINPHPVIGYNFIDKKNIFLLVELSSFTLWKGDSDNLFFGPMIGVNLGFLF